MCIQPDTVVGFALLVMIEIAVDVAHVRQPVIPRIARRDDDHNRRIAAPNVPVGIPALNKATSSGWAAKNTAPKGCWVIMQTRTMAHKRTISFMATSRIDIAIPNPPGKFRNKTVELDLRLTIRPPQNARNISLCINFWFRSNESRRADGTLKNGIMSRGRRKQYGGET